jgi:hypothetical protein
VRYILSLLVLAFATIAAIPAKAQVIPDPAAGKSLYIRDRNGKIVERLQPDGNQYDVYDSQRQFMPIGHARLLGRRMVIYDMQDNIVATMRAELLPPDSPLSVITVVRDAQGHPIGLLERH